MPFISDAQLERVQNHVSSVTAAARRFKEEKKEQIEKVVRVSEIVGAAAAAGYVRGKYEKDGSKFVIPGTSIDIQAVAAVAALGAGAAGLAGKYDDDLLNVGAGLAAGYMQDVMRNMGKTDTFSMVAGAPHIVTGGSHLGHQFGHPSVGSMNDALRSALST